MPLIDFDLTCIPLMLFYFTMNPGLYPSSQFSLLFYVSPTVSTLTICIDTIDDFSK